MAGISAPPNPLQMVAKAPRQRSPHINGDEPSPESVKKRVRKSLPKVRTGCTTCKTRRVKCDETRPSCLRCQKFGRPCDGYAPEPAKGRHLIQIQPRVQSTGNIHGIMSNMHNSEAEDRYFNIFCQQTALELSGFKENPFWTRIVLQTSHDVPAIRHSVIALAALGESLKAAPNTGLKVNIIQDIDKRHHQMAVYQHQKAIECLKQYLALGRGQLRNTLIACLLFICFETFQGSYASSVQHMYGGLKILKNYYLKQGRLRPKRVQRALPELPPISTAENNKIHEQIKSRVDCDYVSNNDTISQVVIEHLEGTSADEFEESPTFIDQDYHMEMSPSPYDPKVEQITIPPSMGGTDFNKEQSRTMNMYPIQSYSQGNTASTAHSPVTPLVLRGSSVSIMPAPMASPTAHTPPASTPHTPSSIMTVSTQASTPNYKQALALQSPTPGQRHYSELKMEEALIQSLVRLDGQGLLFGMIPAIPPIPWDIHDTWQLRIPNSFADLQDAQLCWDFLMDRVLQFYRLTCFDRTYAPGKSQSQESILKQYTKYLGQINDFSNAFQHILDGAIAPSGVIVNAGALVLSLYVKCTVISLAIIPEKSEMRYDDFLNDFKYITTTCEYLVASQRNTRLPLNPRFSFEIGIIPPLHVVAIHCRDPVVRRHAISLLFSSPRQEGMWDGILSARIGNWLCQCEEEGLPPPPLHENYNWPVAQRFGDQPNAAQTNYPTPPNFEDDMGGTPVHSMGNSPTTPSFGPMGGSSALGNEIDTEARAWIIPEEKRVELKVVEFHIPERFIKVKCERVVAGADGQKEEREAVICW